MAHTPDTAPLGLDKDPEAFRQDLAIASRRANTRSMHRASSTSATRGDLNRTGPEPFQPAPVSRLLMRVVSMCRLRYAHPSLDGARPVCTSPEAIRLQVPGDAQWGFAATVECAESGVVEADRVELVCVWRESLLQPSGAHEFESVHAGTALKGRDFSNFRASHHRVIAGPSPARVEELRQLADIAASGAFTPLIDRVYLFAHLFDAHRRVETRHKRGSVVVALANQPIDA